MSAIGVAIAPFETDRVNKAREQALTVSREHELPEVTRLALELVDNLDAVRNPPEDAELELGRFE